MVQLDKPKDDYLGIKVRAKWLLGHAMAALVKGEEFAYINLFKNESKTKDNNHPSFKFREGALWVKKPTVKEEPAVEEIFY